MLGSSHTLLSRAKKLEHCSDFPAQVQIEVDVATPETYLAVTNIYAESNGIISSMRHAIMGGPSVSPETDGFSS